MQGILERVGSMVSPRCQIETLHLKHARRMTHARNARNSRLNPPKRQDFSRYVNSFLSFNKRISSHHRLKSSRPGPAQPLAPHCCLAAPWRGSPAPPPAPAHACAGSHRPTARRTCRWTSEAYGLLIAYKACKLGSKLQIISSI